MKRAMPWSDDEEDDSSSDDESSAIDTDNEDNSGSTYIKPNASSSKHKGNSFPSFYSLQKSIFLKICVQATRETLY